MRSKSLHAAVAAIALLMLCACTQEKPGNGPKAAAPLLTSTSASAPSVPASPSETRASATPVKAEAAAAPRFNSGRAMQYVKTVVAIGPRYVGSPGHAKMEALLRSHLKADRLEEDAFTASTPLGAKQMRNFIAKFPGPKDGIIVIAGHYDTLYGRKDFVGANDAGSSTGFLMELASELRGRKMNGYSVWLVWLDGEEAFRTWSPTDSLYGSRHLAEKWQKDGTLPKIKAFLLVDMIADADLNIDREENSTPWLEDLAYQAATHLGYQSHFFRRTIAVEDDHIPFVRLGVPSADLIDFDYGYANAYWHTREDTLDKLSSRSLDIVGDVVLETVRLLDER
ncbi:MAG: M28 family peptidase [Terriglobales bacterium]